MKTLQKVCLNLWLQPNLYEFQSGAAGRGGASSNSDLWAYL